MELKPLEKKYTSDDIKKNVKRNIVRLRTANKLKMREVARAIGANENTYRIWEDPKRSCPKPHDIMNLAKIYNVSTDFIMGGDDNVSPESDIASRSKYNYTSGESYLSELDSYEKLMIMSLRRLTLEDKAKLSEEVYKLLNK